jgi:hypothetical protein
MSALREETVRFVDAGVPGCFEAGCLVPGARRKGRCSKEPGSRE